MNPNTMLSETLQSEKLFGELLSVTDTDSGVEIQVLVIEE